MPIPPYYLETLNTPKASRHIEAQWSYCARQDGKALVLPDGRCDIILRFDVNSSCAPVPIITGPATEAYQVEYRAGDCWIGLRLRPSNGHLLWQGDIAHAANKVLRGNEALALIPELDMLVKQRPIPTTLAQVADSALLLSQPRHPNQKIENALDILHVTGGRLSIDELADRVECSSRHLSRLFQQTVGIPTKIYAQLVQFHRTLSLLQNTQMAITDAALEGGYSDQAHLNRAFKRFGGFAPSRTPNGLSMPTLFTV